VTRLTTGKTGLALTLGLHAMRFVRDAALSGTVSYDASTGSVYAAVSLVGSDGSVRAFVITWDTTQARGFASARGSSDGHALLLVLRAPSAY
jgi:hypothetical protein